MPIYSVVAVVIIHTVGYVVHVPSIPKRTWSTENDWGNCKPVKLKDELSTFFHYLKHGEDILHVLLNS